MTTTYESRNGPQDDGADEVDPEGRLAPFPGETRAQACRRWAREDEVEEDPEMAARAAVELAALREEELFVTEVGERAFVTLPAAVRRLFRQNPNNARIRALYDATMRELADRTDDKLRGALLPAVDRMIELVDSDDEKVALRAATYVFERLQGKTPEVINHTQDQPFMVMLERIVPGPRIAAAAPTALEAGSEPLDAEIVAESDSAPNNASPELRQRIRELTTPEDDPYAEELALARAWEDVARRFRPNR